jgi:large conductance mechanosensitive channel
MGFVKDFKNFAFRGNVIDLAIGVIIGAAFTKIINSVVDDLIMPLINPFMPPGGWQRLTIYPGIKLGTFLSVVLNFLIVAFILFLIVRAITKLRKKEETVTPPEVVPNNTEKLLMEIRDNLKQQNARPQ